MGYGVINFIFYCTNGFEQEEKDIKNNNLYISSRFLWLKGSLSTYFSLIYINL